MNLTAPTIETRDLRNNLQRSGFPYSQSSLCKIQRTKTEQSTSKVDSNHSHHVLLWWRSAQSSHWRRHQLRIADINPSITRTWCALINKFKYYLSLGRFGGVGGTSRTTDPLLKTWSVEKNRVWGRTGIIFSTSNLISHSIDRLNHITLLSAYQMKAETNLYSN